MKLNELPDANVLETKVKIPADVKQLSEPPLTEGWIAGYMLSGEGVFMTCDPPGSKTRRLTPTYPTKQRDVMNWEVAEDDITKNPG